MEGLLDRPASVYRHLDAQGRLLYVGTCGSIETRTLQHNRYSPWAKEIASITVRHFDTRRDALAHEREVIASENPRYNIWCAGLPAQKAAAARRSVLALESKVVEFKPCYTTTQAAALLCIGEALLERMVNEGDIGSFKIYGTRTLITGWQLIEFLEAASLKKNE